MLIIQIHLCRPSFRLKSLSQILSSGNLPPQDCSANFRHPIETIVVFSRAVPSPTDCKLDEWIRLQLRAVLLLAQQQPLLHPLRLCLCRDLVQTVQLLFRLVLFVHQHITRMRERLPVFVKAELKHHACSRRRFFPPALHNNPTENFEHVQDVLDGDDDGVSLERRDRVALAVAIRHEEQRFLAHIQYSRPLHGLRCLSTRRAHAPLPCKQPQLLPYQGAKSTAQDDLVQNGTVSFLLPLTRRVSRQGLLAPFPCLSKEQSRLAAERRRVVLEGKALPRHAENGDRERASLRGTRHDGAGGHREVGRQLSQARSALEADEGAVSEEEALHRGEATDHPAWDPAAKILHVNRLLLHPCLLPSSHVHTR
mmetsp:Transcript_9914/g.33112  ORF Transcript_9914/g.33112 Transcript_9914/m.33112 type:complete len:367 (-) Transcript_9914:178-1278(-)